MNLIEAYQAQLDLIHQERDLIHRANEIYNKITEELIEQKNVTKQEALIPKLDIDTVKELPKQKKSRGQVSYMDLVEIIKPILVTNPKMPSKELEAYLEENFGFKWKTFVGTIRKLIGLGLIKIKIENIDGEYYYSLKEE